MIQRRFPSSPSAFAWTTSLLAHACLGIVCYLTPGGYGPAARLDATLVVPAVALAFVSAAEPTPTPPVQEPEPPRPEPQAIERPPIPRPPTPEPPETEVAARQPSLPAVPAEEVAWATSPAPPTAAPIEFPAPEPPSEPCVTASAAPAPTKPPEAEPPRGSDLASAVAPASRADNPPPSYPWAARRRGYEGLVVLIVRVSRVGAPLAVRVKQSSGHSLLDEAATAAVWTWRFEPAVLEGTPVEAQMEIPIRFRLTD